MKQAMAAAVLEALLGAPMPAGARPAEHVDLGAPECRVRAEGHEAQRLLGAAVTASPTVARLVADLQATDLVVTVELKPLPKQLNGYVQVAAATPVARYLRLVVGVPKGESELMAVLGHELRHTLESAATPDVRDDESLARAYRRIGTAQFGNGRWHETEAALETGRIVAREVAVAGHSGRATAAR
jgi:hypothetical protein